MSALVFKLAAAAAGRTHTNFSQAHKVYPFKTFGLLKGKVTPADLVADGRERKCVQDKWTKSLLSYFADNLEDPALMLEVYTIALLAHIDAAAIEAKHAGIRRNLKGRVQTNAFAAERASSAFVLRSVTHPSLVVGELAKANISIDKGTEGDTSDEERWPAGGGGAWRAYCSEQARGVTGALIDFKEVAKSYRELSPEEMHRLRAKGAEATQRHALGGSAFGRTEQELRRDERMDYKRARVDATRSAMRDARNPGDGGTATTGTELAPMALTSDFSDTDISLLKQRVAAETHAERCVSQVVNEDLLAQSSTEHGPVSSVLPEGDRPACQAIEQHAWCVPCGAPSLVHVELQIRGLAKAAAAFCNKKLNHMPGLAALANALDRDWQQKHVLIDHDNQAGLGKYTAPKTEKCLLAGRCFCVGDGKILHAMIVRLKKVLRSHFAKGRPGRPHMEAGTVACFFIGEPPADDSDIGNRF